MSFKVTIEVEDKELGPLLAKLPKCKYDLKHVASLVTEPVTNGKATTKKYNTPAKPDTKMKMTGKIPRNSELLASGLDLFEKMELEHGIGSITVEVLRNQIDANKMGLAGVKFQSRLVHEGYLEYIR